jgi:hypothetical protein
VQVGAGGGRRCRCWDGTSGLCFTDRFAFCPRIECFVVSQMPPILKYELLNFSAESITNLGGLDHPPTGVRGAGCRAVVEWRGRGTVSSVLVQPPLLNFPGTTTCAVRCVYFDPGASLQARTAMRRQPARRKRTPARAVQKGGGEEEGGGGSIRMCLRLPCPPTLSLSAVLPVRLCARTLGRGGKVGACEWPWLAVSTAQQECGSGPGPPWRPRSKNAAADLARRVEQAGTMQQGSGPGLPCRAAPPGTPCTDRTATAAGDPHVTPTLRCSRPLRTLLISAPL